MGDPFGLMVNARSMESDPIDYVVLAGIAGLKVVP